ncbi:MAG TPA: hypothetical protein VK700_15155 [Steroidobacteraceae bacterium]|jgi:hypothetical protein|nr:hypothetical protein [Steroidobacteraceae bacterium]
MASDKTDYKQVGRELYVALRRLTELLRLYESKQWPPATPEQFDGGLSAMVTDEKWRQGATLRIQDQRKCAVALEAAGMSAIAAQRVAGFKRDKSA